METPKCYQMLPNGFLLSESRSMQITSEEKKKTQEYHSHLFSFLSSIKEAEGRNTMMMKKIAMPKKKMLCTHQTRNKKGDDEERKKKKNRIRSNICGDLCRPVTLKEKT